MAPLLIGTNRVEDRMVAFQLKQNMHMARRVENLKTLNPLGPQNFAEGYV